MSEQEEITGHVQELLRSERELFELEHLPPTVRLALSDEQTKRLPTERRILRRKIELFGQFVSSGLARLGQVERSAKLAEALSELESQRQRQKQAEESSLSGLGDRHSDGKAATDHPGYPFFRKLLERKQEFAIEQHLADLGMKAQLQRQAELERATGQVNEARRIVWLGSARQWGDMVMHAYDDGLIDATGPLDALQQWAKHFLWKNPDKPDKSPEPFKPRSVYQSLKNRDEYQNPKKPGPR